MSTIEKEDCLSPAQVETRLSTARTALERSDYALAAQIYREILDRTDSGAAAYQLGALYSQGRGLEKNDLAALYWFNKAEEQGVLEAGADCDGIFQTYYRNFSREDFADRIGLLAHWCRTGRGPVPLDRERGAYWTGRMEKVLHGPGKKGPS